jgi:cytochrome c553
LHFIYPDFIDYLDTDMKLFISTFTPYFTAALLAFSSISGLAATEAAKPEVKVDASVVHIAEPAKAAKPDLVKGEASFTAVCAACHGADGNSGTPVNPKLSQQHPEYLVKQLQEFKSGKRNNAIMKGFASALSDEDMRNIAYWAASKKAKPGFAKDKELVALGEKIYRGGISDRQIPACASCHSPTGAGIPAQYPRLSGQHADYTMAQLNTFREGSRKNSIQMTQVSAKLNDREIKAVSDYIAGLR